jgi:hypothetical protein
VPFHQFVSLDVGQSRDPSALCIIEEPLWIPAHALEDGGWADALNITAEALLGESGWVSPNHPALTPPQVEEIRSINYHYGKPSRTPLHLTHLERFPLGTPYPDVVDGVIRRVKRTKLRGKHTVLMVDETGVGRAITDLFRMRGVSPYGITITGGDNVNWDKDTQRFRTPARELIHKTQVAAQQGLLIAPKEGLPLAKVFQHELRRFKVKPNRSRNNSSDRYEAWRENDTDDLVFAVSMACWFRMHNQRLIDEANARMRR